MKKIIIVSSLIALTLTVFGGNSLHFSVTGSVLQATPNFAITMTDWTIPITEVGSIPQGKFNTTFNFTAPSQMLTQYPIALTVQSSGSWLGMEYIKIISPNASNLVTLDNQVYALNQLYYAGNNKPNSYDHTFLFEVAPKEIGYINGSLTFTATYRSGT